MSGHISSGLGSKQIKTFALLDQIVTVLGTTKASFWPFFSAGRTTNPNIESYGSGTTPITRTASIAAGAQALLDLFEPHQFPSGLYSYRFIASSSYHLAGADHANHSFGTGLADTAFSLGVWCQLNEAVGTARSLIAKYRTDAATLREYDFRFSATGYPILELYDESVPASWTSTCTVNVLTPLIWQFVVVTYSGTEGASSIVHYLNAVAETPTAAESGLYVAMEDTTAPALIGARNITTNPATPFEGRLALPFITGTALTAANVTTLYGLGKELMGL